MDILKLPIASFLGIKLSMEENFLLEMPFKKDLTNHLQTYHASVLYSLAEMSSGHFLVKNFPEETITTYPLVRRSNIKYSTIPKNHLLRTKGHLVNQKVSSIRGQLQETGKVIINIQIDIFDVTDKLILRGQFEWFVRFKSENLKISQTASLIKK